MKITELPISGMFDENGRLVGISTIGESYPFTFEKDKSPPNFNILDNFYRSSDYTVVKSTDATYNFSSEGKVKPTCLNLSLPAASSNIYATKDIRFNLNAFDGLWLHARFNYRQTSSTLGYTLYLSEATGLASGTGRWSVAASSATSLLVGEQLIWIPKSSFAVLDGTPNFANDLLSFRVRMDASVSSGKKDVDFLGLYLGGSKPTIMITTDDGWSDAYWLHSQAQKRCIPLTHYLIASTINGPLYLTTAQILEMRANGDYMGLHGYDVWSTNSRIIKDANDLRKTGLSDCKHAAFPLGDIGYGYSWKDTKQVLSGVGVETARISAGAQTPTIPGYVEQHALPTYPLNSSTTLAQAKAAVDTAITSGGSLIFYGHKFASVADPETWTQSDTIELLDYINMKRMQKLCSVKTVSDWWESFT